MMTGRRLAGPLPALSLLFAPFLAAEEARPPFEKLLQLNAAKIFGGEVHIEGDRVTIHFKKPGQFNRAFEGTGIVNPEEIKGEANKKILERPAWDDREKKKRKKEDGGGGAIPNVAVVGRGDGDWQSRFELSGDVKFAFKLRIPAIQKEAQLSVWLNKTPKSYIQTSFFQTAVLHWGGRTKRAAAPKEYQVSPDKWFDKLDLVPVEMLHQMGKFSVKMKGNEILAFDEAGDASSGRIALSFRKLAFVLSDVEISGKFDRAWCEGQLKDLEEKKELVSKDPPPPAAAEPPSRKAAKKDGDDKAQKEKDAEEEL